MFLIKLAAEECRIFRKHIDFSHQFSHQERIELIHGAHIMLTRQRQRANISSQRSKRNYKRWSQHEIFTLYLAIALYGMSFPKIEKVFVDDDGQSTRNSSQVLSLLFLLIVVVCLNSFIDSPLCEQKSFQISHRFFFGEIVDCGSSGI